jgi:hypothetical protein
VWRLGVLRTRSGPHRLYCLPAHSGLGGGGLAGCGEGCEGPTTAGADAAERLGPVGGGGGGGGTGGLVGCGGGTGGLVGCGGGRAAARGVQARSDVAVGRVRAASWLLFPPMAAHRYTVNGQRSSGQRSSGQRSTP